MRVQLKPQGTLSAPKITIGLEAEPFTLTRQALTRKFIYSWTL